MNKYKSQNKTEIVFAASKIKKKKRCGQNQPSDLSSFTAVISVPDFDKMSLIQFCLLRTLIINDTKNLESHTTAAQIEIKIEILFFFFLFRIWYFVDKQQHTQKRVHISLPTKRYIKSS